MAPGFAVGVSERGAFGGRNVAYGLKEGSCAVGTSSESRDGGRCGCGEGGGDGGGEGGGEDADNGEEDSRAGEGLLTGLGWRGGGFGYCGCCWRSEGLVL